MVIELHTALEAVETYFNDDTKEHVILGGMAGTQLFKHVFDLSLGYFRFNEILLIEGCQDYIGMSDPSPYNNHFFFAELLYKQPTHSLFNNFNDPFSWNILNNGNPIMEYHTSMNMERINRFKLVIVTDAHLIPAEYIKELRNYVSGKLIELVDPFTIFGARYTQVPTVINTNASCDQLTALARKVYNVETDFIEPSQHKSLEVSHQNASRTMSKNSDGQYCTTSMGYLEYMQEKQLKMGFRKGHKVMVDGPNIMTYKMDNTEDTITICNHSLMTIEAVPGTLHSTFGCKLWRFKDNFHAHLVFNTNRSLLDLDNTLIRVKPAGVLSLMDASYHKFNKLTYVHTISSPELSNPEKYTLLTATEHLVIVEE